MKKVYSQPKVRKVRVIASTIMACSYTGYPEPNPEMGTSASEGTPTMGNDVKRHWKDF